VIPDRVPKQGVVFDLDGVLVMSEHLWEESWTTYAARYRYAWTSQDTRNCQGKSVSEWGVYLGSRSSGDAEAAAADVIALVLQAYRSGRVTLVDGAAELIAAVASQVVVGLASSAPRTIIDTVMATMGIGRYFSATVSSAEVARGKPSPDVYAEAVNRLGIDPARSVAVEDSSNGVRAAAAAGLTVVAVVHQQYPLAPDAVALSNSVRSTLSQVGHDIERLLQEQAAAEPKR
jgi:HAD superfamily hydrolase (TIGR01509 family)